jgi:hypothetical protein
METLKGGISRRCTSRTKPESGTAIYARLWLIALYAIQK